MNPKVSLIIPVYKVEKYLPRCLESVAAQTYDNFETILVDDGSPDRCGEICDAFAAALGWKVKTDLKDAIEKTVRGMRE